MGYMPVRTEADREQIEVAESLYYRMRAEEASGRLVHRRLHLDLALRLRTAWMTESNRRTHNEGVGEMKPAMGQLSVSLMPEARATAGIAQGNLDLLQRTKPRPSV